jgi:hypothetical protein
MITDENDTIDEDEITEEDDTTKENDVTDEEVLLVDEEQATTLLVKIFELDGDNFVLEEVTDFVEDTSKEDDLTELQLPNADWHPVLQWSIVLPHYYN